MLRNSILYRRLWYIRKRNIRKIHILIRLTIAMIVLSFAITTVTGRLIPSLQNFAGTKVQSEVASIMKEIVNDTLKKSALYDDYIIVDKKQDDAMTSIELDRSNLNILSELIAGKLSGKLEILDDRALPVSSLVPFFTMKIKQDGNVATRYFSEFKQIDMDLTKHTILLEVSKDVTYESLLFAGRTSVNITVPIAEGTIIGIGTIKESEASSP